ncbi:helix-turn-helix domain-containing protein [Microbacterium sp. HMH0099]|uniref:AraC family transcriptional regulator n=1 Tax=Microbacterium sp. HMH0099 TaxID=3414026 RepID=UPI003BF687C5
MTTAASRPRRLDGAAMKAWFSDHGWRATSDLTYGYAFIDEEPLLSTVLRRVWHTASTFERRSSSDLPQPAVCALMQVEGETHLRTTVGEKITLSQGSALICVATQLTAMHCTAPSARIEVEFRVAAPDPIRTQVLSRRMDDGVPWAALTSAVNGILNSPPDTSPTTNFALQAGIIGLVSALRADMTERARQDALIAPDATLYQKALAYIDADSSDPDCTIQTLARRLGVSPRHLARTFQAHGASPREVLARRRYRAALLLMQEEPRPPLAQIAREAGFSSADALRYQLRHRRGRS